MRIEWNEQEQKKLNGNRIELIGILTEKIKMPSANKADQPEQLEHPNATESEQPKQSNQSNQSNLTQPNMTNLLCKNCLSPPFHAPKEPLLCCAAVALVNPLIFAGHTEVWYSDIS